VNLLSWQLNFYLVSSEYNHLALYIFLSSNWEFNFMKLCYKILMLNFPCS
jgi:hypothetical protein